MLNRAEQEWPEGTAHTLTSGHAAGWRRLQRISCHHAAVIGPQRGWTVFHPCVYVPEVIRENVEILGRGTEEEIKARILWYVTFYPSIFSAS
jgi:hypothetical protein